MTLQALRNEIGDKAFFEVLRAWHAKHRDDNAGTDELIALAEKISRKSLDALFQTWLYTPSKPVLAAADAGAAAFAALAGEDASDGTFRRR